MDRKWARLAWLGSTLRDSESGLFVGKGREQCRGGGLGRPESPKLKFSVLLPHVPGP